VTGANRASNDRPVPHPVSTRENARHFGGRFLHEEINQMTDMRSNQEQLEGLHSLAQAASRLHRINLQLRQPPGDVPEVTGAGYAENVAAVYTLGGYDVWVYNVTPERSCCSGWNNCQGHVTHKDLSLEDAAQIMAGAYMEHKARFIITNTWGESPREAERILRNPKRRQRMFREMDAGSDIAREKIISRHVN
jgi:hypothetical protein